jgi:hypothetical protein
MVERVYTHDVAMSQPRPNRTPAIESAVVTARIAPSTYAALAEIADRNYRSISSHVRSLIEADVAAADLEEAA